MTNRPRCRGCFLVGLALAASLWTPPADAAAGNFVARSCNRNAAARIGAWTRAQAKSYAAVAAGEGYQWGGCWNDNNRDDQPGDPQEVITTYGEGPDCSGLVFKSWALAGDSSGADRGYYRHEALTYLHGPFGASTFTTRNLNAFGPAPKASAASMDAFASSRHIGLVYQANANGTDQIVEATGEAYGTRITTEAFRGNPDFLRSPAQGLERHGIESGCGTPASLVFVAKPRYTGSTQVGLGIRRPRPVSSRLPSAGFTASTSTRSARSLATRSRRPSSVKAISLGNRPPHG